jgi:hypothetical protein
MAKITHPARAVNGTSTCVASKEWDEVFAAPEAAHEALERWQQAVAQATMAVANHPDFIPNGERLKAGAMLAAAKAVRLHQDGSATVESVDKTYTLAPDCSCPDAQHRTKYCKHRLARLITEAAYAQLAPPPPTPVTNGKDAAMDDTLPLPPPPVTPPLPTGATIHLGGAVMTESPYSLNVRVQKDGFVFQVTVRKQKRDELLDALQGLPEWFAAHGFEPAPEGKGAKALPQGEIPICPYHGPMKPSEKAKGTFYCPAKMGDGSFCKEKHPKAA